MLKIFQTTIKELKKKIESLELEVAELITSEAEAIPGGDGWHSCGFRSIQQKRIGVEKTLLDLKKQLHYSRPIDPPESNTRVALGHEVHIKPVTSPKGSPLILHVCNEADLKIVGEYVTNSKQRMVSVSSPIGKKLLGQTKGNEILIGDTKYTIESICTSSLL